MGGLNFSDFDSLFLIYPWFAHIYLFLLMVITNITLLNFVIAILSNTYTVLTEQGAGIYLRFVLTQNKLTGYNKHFSSLISALPGFDIFFLPFLPF